MWLVWVWMAVWAQGYVNIPDDQTRAMFTVLARTPNELDQTGRSDLKTFSELRVRFALLDRIGRQCQAAEELKHFLVRHKGKLPEADEITTYNALVQAGYDLRLYDLPPWPGNRGRLIIPSGPIAFILDRVPGTTAASMMVGTIEDVERAPLIGGSLINLTIACAGPNPTAIGEALKGLDRWVREVGLLNELSASYPIRLQLDLLRADAAVLADGLSPANREWLERLNMETTHTIVQKLKQDARIIDRQRTLMHGLSAEKLHKLYGAAVRKDSSILSFQHNRCNILSDLTSPSKLVDIDTALEDKILHHDEFDALREQITLVQSLRLLGCDKAQPAMFTSHPEVVDWLDSLPHRWRSVPEQSTCKGMQAQLLTGLKPYRQAKKGSTEAYMVSIVRSVLFNAVGQGCATITDTPNTASNDYKKSSRH